MRKKLLSTLRASVAVLFVAVQLPLMSLFIATANADEACNDSNSQNTNSECYWEAQGNGSCTKDDGPFTGTTYTLPTAPNGQTYTLLVVNGGSNDATYTNPSAGTPYTAPLNNGGQYPTISHAIYCTETSNTTVTPSAVTFVDLCGTENDTYTVPSTTGVDYQVNAQTVAANTYSGSGTVTVNAVAQTGFTLTGTTSWSHTFTDVACDSHVTPGTVTFGDLCGTDEDTFNVPSTTGVTYHLGTAGGTLLSAGDHPATGSVTVVAVADQGFVLDGTTSWSHDFTNDECPPPPVDVCPNLAGDQATLPVGFVLQNDHTCKVVICHATAAIKNPYVQLTVAIDSVDGNTGNDNGLGDHFAEHTGPIFNSTMENGDNWGDIIPPVPGIHNGLNWTTAGQAIYNNDCNVPTPPVDVCPNIEGNQSSVPTGMVKDENGDCVTPPPVDVCPNIDGNQTTVPSGMVKDNNGNCVTPPADVCPNIEGTQTSVPSGMVVDTNGNCVTPGRGGEVTPPVLVSLVTPPAGQVLGAATTAAPSAAQLVNTGSSALVNVFAGMFLMGIAALVTILSRKTGGNSLISADTTSTTI